MPTTITHIEMTKNRTTNGQGVGGFCRFEFITNPCNYWRVQFDNSQIFTTNLTINVHTFFFLITTEARIEISRMEIIIASDNNIGISKLKNAASIFKPTNVRTKARPIFK